MSKNKQVWALGAAADRPRRSKFAKVEESGEDGGGNGGKVSSSNWYDSPAGSAVSDQPTSPDAAKKWFDVAEGGYKEQVAKYQAALDMTASDREWFLEVTKRGTLKDKLVAYAMAVQEGPFYALDHLSAVLALTLSQNRHESLAASETFTDVLAGNGLLPRHRKLYYMHQRPLPGDRDTACNAARDTTRDTARDTTRDLVLWYFEDRIKTIYFSFLKVIERLLQDNVEYTRERAMRLLFDLTMACPTEQQASSLAMLANKLGDPHKKLSSRVIFYLEELCKAHPTIVLPTVHCVKEVIARPKVPERAQYYGLTFLSQLQLSRRDPAMASSLLSLYTVFFKNVVVPELVELNKKKRQAGRAKPGDADAEPSRVTKAVLMGINRTLPFAVHSDDSKKVVGGFVEPLLKLSKMANINIAVLALSIFHQLSKITDHPLHRKLLFGQLGQLCGDWMRLAKFSNTFPAIFHLLDRIVEGELQNDGQLERLLKRVANASVHLNTHFALLALQWMARAFATLPRLRALVCMPPESVDEVSEASLFELVALVDHHDPLVRECASSLVKAEVFPVIKDVASESGILTFIDDLERLHSTTRSSKAIVAAAREQRGVVKRTRQKKTPDMDALSDEAVDDEAVDDGAVSSRGATDDDDFDDEGFFDDELDDELDDDEMEVEDVFESADEVELE